MSPPRQVRLDYSIVAEITDSSSTVGVADSGLIYKSQADIDKTLDELQALGVNNIRVLVPWAVVEQSDNSYYWTQMDAVMSAAAARNMGVMADINSTPLWAAPANTFPGAGTPPVAQFAEFVQQVATRYGSTISAYEIWNEPNYALYYQPIDPVSYTALLAAAYPVIKSIDPTATVVAGALGAGPTFGQVTMNPVDFVSAMMAAGAGSYFDALSFHPYQESLPFSAGYTYPGLQTPLVQLDAIKALIGATKSVWISEYGLPTNNVSQQQQSNYIKDLLDYWQTYSQSGPVFLYTSVDNSTGSTNPEDNYGLFTSNWTPKLAAQMLEAWIAAHPQTPIIVGPTLPGSTPQVNPIAALLQSISQQISQFISQFASLGQTLINAITNLVSSITSALSGIVAPRAVTPAVSPLSLRVASVEAAPVAEPTALDATTTPVDQSVTNAAKTAAKVVDSTVSVPAEVVAPAVKTTPAVVVPVESTTVAAPIATETVVPVVSQPVVTEPAVTTASETTVQSPSVATTPAATTDSSSTVTKTSEKSDADSPATPGSSDGESSTPVKSVKTKADKSGTGAAAKSDDGSTSETATRPRKTGERHPKATAASGAASSAAAANANAGAKSSATSGAGSSGSEG